VVSAGIVFRNDLEAELPVSDDLIPLLPTKVSLGLDDKQGMITTLRAWFHRLHGKAVGAGACSCGAGAHFMAHPCIEHACVAILAFGLSVWALRHG
jgi:hypothetical protein